MNWQNCLVFKVIVRFYADDDVGWESNIYVDKKWNKDVKGPNVSINYVEHLLSEWMMEIYRLDMHFEKSLHTFLWNIQNSGHIGFMRVLSLLTFTNVFALFVRIIQSRVRFKDKWVYIWITRECYCV